MNKWKLSLCRPNDTVKTALRRIDDAGTQIAFVVDESDLVVGALSDGDVRRGLLDGKTLDSHVHELMTTHPVTAQLSSSRAEVKRLFDEFKINLIPVVDANGRLVDVHSIEQFNHRHEISNHIVIMAGGLGTRLLPLTKERPKPLIEIGGRPILETIIHIAAEQGFRNFILSVGYKAEMIQDFFGDGSNFDVRIQYVQEEQSLGTAGALSLLDKAPDEDFIVMNGDVLNRVDLAQLLRHHCDAKNSLTMAARYLETQIPYGVVETKGEYLEKIVEKPTLRHLINTGIYACNPEILEFCIRNEPLAMTDLITTLMQRDHKVGVFETNSYWLDVGQLDELARAQSQWNFGSND